MRLPELIAGPHQGVDQIDSRVLGPDGPQPLDGVGAGERTDLGRVLGQKPGQFGARIAAIQSRRVGSC